MSKSPTQVKTEKPSFETLVLQLLNEYEKENVRNDDGSAIGSVFWISFQTKNLHFQPKVEIFHFGGIDLRTVPLPTLGSAGSNR